MDTNITAMVHISGDAADFILDALDILLDEAGAELDDDAFRQIGHFYNSMCDYERVFVVLEDDDDDGNPCVTSKQEILYTLAA